MNKSKYIAIDFDGTIAIHKYPQLGEILPEAVEVMKDLQACGHSLILFTMRTGKELQEALSALEEKGISFYGVNNNPSQERWAPTARKVFAHTYIDDMALGSPLVYPEGERAYTDWKRVKELLAKEGFLTTIDLEK